MAMPHRLEPGELFEERYRVKHIIGAGGFAVVYLAEQVDLGREVALKVMRPAEKLSEEGADVGNSYSEKIVGRFEREAKLVSQLRDPNTITMYDYGQSKDGRLYMVFEFVDGISLKELLEDVHDLSAQRTVKILRQVLMSLQEAHAVGVFHRDLKPANVMVFDQVGRKDQIKLLDFGIATRAIQDQKDLTQNLTEEGTLLGTPRYMAPEQIRGHELTPSSDLYSLALVAYEMLTGRRAIGGTTSVEVISKQIAPESVRVPVDLSIPPHLRQILDKMLQKNPKLRYQQAAEVLADLEHWDSDEFAEEAEDVAGLDATVVEPFDRGEPELTRLLQEDTAANGANRGKRLAIAALVMLFVVGGAAYGMLGGDKASTGAQTSEVSAAKPKPPVGEPANDEMAPQDEEHANSDDSDEVAGTTTVVGEESSAAEATPESKEQANPAAKSDARPNDGNASDVKRSQPPPTPNPTAEPAPQDKPAVRERAVKPPKKERAAKPDPAAEPKGTDSGETEESSPFFTLD